MPGKGTPRGIEKNFLQMSRLGTCWQCFLKIPATGLYARWWRKRKTTAWSWRRAGWDMSMSTGTKRRSCGRILRARKALDLLPAVRMCATSHAMSNFSVPTCPVRLAFVREGARSLYAGQLEPATAFSAGIDLRACLDEDGVRIPAGGRFCVPAGISVQPCEAGFAGFLYSRSGLGAREGLTVAQGVGVIDPDYTGEILVMLLNTSGEERILKRGERMAQLVFQPFVRPVWQEVESLSATERGAGGFGHTGR